MGSTSTTASDTIYASAATTTIPANANSDANTIYAGLCATFYRLPTTSLGGNLQLRHQSNSSMSMQGAWPSQNVYSRYGNQPVYSTQSSSNFSSLQGNRTLHQSNSFHNPPSANDDLNSIPPAITNGSSSSLINMGRKLQQVNSFPSRMGNRIAMNGSTTVLNNGSAGIPSSGQKSYIPSYRLF